MQNDRSFEDIRDLIEGTQPTQPPQRWVEMLLAAAEQIPVGGEGRAELLWVAGESLTSQGDAEAALPHLHAAVGDGGWTTIDPRSGVVDALLQLGRDEELAAYLAQARREVSEIRSDITLPAAVGEILEMAERGKEAERWYTIGLRDFDPAVDDDPDIDEETCLWGRYRLRRARDAALDSFDRWTVADDPE